MSWEQQISDLLQEAQSIAVMFNVDQGLSNTQKQTAQNNIGTTTTAAVVSGDDYKVTFNY